LLLSFGVVFCADSDLLLLFRFSPRNLGIMLSIFCLDFLSVRLYLLSKAKDRSSDSCQSDYRKDPCESAQRSCCCFLPLQAQ
jgi:hypothetical protein